MKGGNTDVDHRRQDHDRQDDHRGDQVGSSSKAMRRRIPENSHLDFIHQRVQQVNTQQSINNGRDPGQKLHRRLYNSGQLGRSDLLNKHSRQNADGRSDHHGGCRTHDRRQDNV